MVFKACRKELRGGGGVFLKRAFNKLQCLLIIKTLFLCVTLKMALLLLLWVRKLMRKKHAVYLNLFEILVKSTVSFLIGA